MHVKIDSCITVIIFYSKEIEIYDSNSDVNALYQYLIINFFSQFYKSFGHEVVTSKSFALA